MTPSCHCGKGCKVIIVPRNDAKVPTTKCYLDYLHKLWKLKK